MREFPPRLPHHRSSPGEHRNAEVRPVFQLGSVTIRGVPLNMTRLRPEYLAPETSSGFVAADSLLRKEPDEEEDEEEDEDDGKEQDDDDDEENDEGYSE
jgi:hypothetical protein